MDLLLERVGGFGSLRSGGGVRTDSTRVLALARELNRLEFVVETLRCALEAPAVAAPRLAVLLPGGGRILAGALLTTRGHLHLPRRKETRAELGQTVGMDGYALLESVYHRP